MRTTYCYKVNDGILDEYTLGQSRLDYVTDALGSVIATVDQTITVQSTASNMPSVTAVELVVVCPLHLTLAQAAVAVELHWL